ncbi:MAG TPA: cation:proton antiporter [Kofleriaceae bacterium]|nr:cation:proton antiporter [Kofleriaceae bacterium]
MSWLAWIALFGALLLLFAVASAYVQRLPISTSALYLGLGVVLGPALLGALRLDLAHHAIYVERITELALVVALFSGGLRLRLRWRDPAWRPAFLLAGPVMVVSIVAVAALAHLALGLPLDVAILLAALLAPTDPVLASAVAVKDATDHDGMRYALSGEAGLNDGSAAPFVVLALAWTAHGGAGTWLASWAVAKVLWAVPAALAIGYGLGLIVGRIAIGVRSRARDTSAPSDFLALALIALSYVAAEWIGAWGFLAVFAAGVGLRAAELRVVLAAPHPDIEANDEIDNADHPPAEQLVSAIEAPEALAQPAVAAGVMVSQILSFGDTVERLVEIGLLVAVGSVLVAHWDVRALAIAGALFLVVRPAATMLALGWTRTTAMQRGLIGWFGVRGIGSLYYLAYAFTHGFMTSHARELADLAISVVALSVVVHGVTAQPLLAWYGRLLARASHRR